LKNYPNTAYTADATTPTSEEPVAFPSNGHAPLTTLPDEDPFAASNFAAEGEDVPTGVDDLSFSVGAPDAEEFVYVSSDPRHYLKANLLVVKSEEGFGKSYFLLTPSVFAYCKSQASLKKFVKTFHIFLYVVHEGGYGLWLVPDSLNSWATSDLNVVQTAKRMFVRRFNDNKVRKAHSTDAITTDGVRFPDNPLAGSDGLLKLAFGEAFAITSTDHPVLKRLLGIA
jgi:hypothetical protein